MLYYRENEDNIGKCWDLGILLNKFNFFAYLHNGCFELLGGIAPKNAKLWIF